MGTEYKGRVRNEGTHALVQVFSREFPGGWALVGELRPRAGVETAALGTRLRLAMPVEFDGETRPQLSGHELYETLAEVQHDIWAHWMRYVMDKVCHAQAGVPDGSLVIPADSVAHWQRQCDTTYAGLTERERESDREQVARFWHLVSPSVDDAMLERVTEVMQRELGQAAGSTGRARAEEVARAAIRAALRTTG